MRDPLIPRRLLFGPPRHAAPALSPDGSRLAFLGPVEGVTGVHSGPPGGPYRPLVRSAGSIAAFRWCEDSRYLLYETDQAGDEDWHLHAVDADTGHSRDLTPFGGVQALLVATSPDRPDEVLVALNRDDPRRHDAYRLHVPTGRLTLVARDEGFGTIGGTWLADRDLEVRAALRPTAEGGVEVLARADARWRVVLRGDRDDDLATRLLAVAPDGRSLYLTTSAAPGVGTAAPDAAAPDAAAPDTAALCRLDLDSGELEVVFRDPVHDVGAVFQDRADGTPRAVTVDGVHRRQHLLDDSAAAVLAEVATVVEGAADLEIVGSDRVRTRHVVRREHPRAPVRWFLHDGGAPTGERVRPLFDDRPELAGHRIPERRPVALVARDGLALHGYVTVPDDGPGPWPTVLLVHGGPWARDRWRLDPDAVWLADRGYLVLQVNFRGSTGYGARFVAAGDREWGAAMHDDLVDTVAHAVAAGWAIPDRVAIMGGSYGGYAALVGATRDPPVFRCAVDLCGPSDLRTLLAGIPPYWDSLRALWTARVGDPERDAGLLAERSPLTRAGRIRIPLFVAQGVNDPRVPLREAEQLVAALHAAGVEHEYLPLQGGHLTFELDVELELVARVERFLARHLGGRFEPDGA